jgi:hypothetical protein
MSKNWDWRTCKGSGYAATSKHLVRMGEIADTIDLEEREQFSFVARETYQMMEAALCNCNGQLSMSADRKIDAVFPAYVKCLFE